MYPFAFLSFLSCTLITQPFVKAFVDTGVDYEIELCPVASHEVVETVTILDPVDVRGCFEKPTTLNPYPDITIPVSNTPTCIEKLFYHANVFTTTLFPHVGPPVSPTILASNSSAIVPPPPSVTEISPSSVTRPLSPIVTTSSSLLVPTTTPVPSTPFLLTLSSLRTTKRQASGFVNGTGVASGCNTGSSFYLINNELYEDGLEISTFPGLPYMVLAGSTQVSSITTSFALEDNVLTWRNSNFTDGQALFCLGSNGLIYAVFDQSQTPTDCSPTQLSAIPGVSCPGFNPVYPAVGETS
ncbi:MAG: hypothetical protein Q9227_004689 [Pyrenula ochraceoflavens]